MSYREVDVELVRKACVKYLDNRDSWIDQRRDQLLAEAMKPRWFGLVRGRTRSEAINYLQGIWEFNLLGVEGLQEASRIKSLLALTEIVGKPTILLNAREAWALEDYIEEE